MGLLLAVVGVAKMPGDKLFGSDELPPSIELEVPDELLGLNWATVEFFSPSVPAPFLGFVTYTVLA
jgi:hypothetical protein